MPSVFGWDIFTFGAYAEYKCIPEKGMLVKKPNNVNYVEVYNTIELYEDNLINREEALKRLRYYKPNNQICIVNQEIIDNYLNYEESMDLFYNSITYDLISQGISDMHCRGVRYLTDELLLEYGMMEQIGYPKSN